MGVHDLLKIFKPTMKKIHISELKNKTAAVDMMTWLYRGVYSCCTELNNNIQTDLYLNYPLKMIAMLSQFNIKIVAVFDGKDLKAKAEEDNYRYANKEKNLELAQIIESTGDTEVARKVSKRALTVTDKMINSLIAILKKLGIQCYSAPYEADAQIAFLVKQRICDLAISEDSDLLPYGCPNILFKLSPDGEGLYFEWDKFKSNNEISSLSKELNLIKKMSFVSFIEYCVMLGCDYLDSLKGYGMKGGTKLFNTCGYLELVYKKMCEIDKFKQVIEKFIVDNRESYLSKAKKVVSLFILQTVYNPLSNKLVPLNNLEVNKELSDLINKYEISFSTPDMRSEFYGKQFEDFTHFCNNLNIDKLYGKDVIESQEVIHKYYMKYKDTCVSLIGNYLGKDKESNGLLGFLEEKIKATNEIFDKQYEELNSKKLNLVLDDDEIETLFRNTKRENIEETKEKIINKKVEELVKIEIKPHKPITSLGDLLNSEDVESENLFTSSASYNNFNKLFTNVLDKEDKGFIKKSFLGKKSVFKFN